MPETTTTTTTTTTTVPPACPLPSVFRSLVVSLDSSACDQLRKLGRLSDTVATAFECIYNEDGTFTDGFKLRLCATGCDGVGTGTGGGVTTAAPGGGGVTTAAPSPPIGSPSVLPITNLTMRAFAHPYRDQSYSFTWTPPANATCYSIFRSTGTDVLTSTLIAYKKVPVVSTEADKVTSLVPDNQGVLLFADGGRILAKDHPAYSNSNQLYRYWVQAHDDLDNYSAVAGSIEGFRRLGYRNGAGFVAPQLSFPSYDLQDLGAIPMPAGTYRVVVTLEGGGGGGAGGSLTSGGGGGGRGSALCVVIPAILPTNANRSYKVRTSESSSFSPAGGAAGLDGVDGDNAILESRVGTGPWETVCIAYGGKGGKADGSGGAGGNTPFVSSNGIIISTRQVAEGFSGGAASGTRGGYGGGGTFEQRVPSASLPNSGSSRAVLPGKPGGGSDRPADSLSLSTAVGAAGYGSRATFAFTTDEEAPMAGCLEIIPTSSDTQEVINLSIPVEATLARFNMIAGGGSGGHMPPLALQGCTGAGAVLTANGHASGGGSGEVRYGAFPPRTGQSVTFKARVVSATPGVGSRGGDTTLNVGAGSGVIAKGGFGGAQSCCTIDVNIPGGSGGSGGTTPSTGLTLVAGSTSYGGFAGKPALAQSSSITSPPVLSACLSGLGAVSRSSGAGSGGAGHAYTTPNNGTRGKLILTW